MMRGAFVYYAKLPEQGDVSFVYPTARQAEIALAKSEKTKREKYFVWKLLAYAIEKSFGKGIENFSFSKTANGKWLADGFEFSLSHSGNLLAVAISDHPVGVDVERIATRSTSVVKKILSADELASYSTLDERARTGYFIRKWTEKESAFKCVGEKEFFSERKFSGEFHSERITLDRETYLLTLATPNGVKTFFIKGEV